MSRGWFRIFIFRCSEVGLDFSFLGFQKLDSSFAFIGVQGLDHTLSLLLLCCGCGVRGDLEIRYQSVLVDLERSHDVTHNFQVALLVDPCRGARR